MSLPMVDRALVQRCVNEYGWALGVIERQLQRQTELVRAAHNPARTCRAPEDDEGVSGLPRRAARKQRESGSDPQSRLGSNAAFGAGTKRAHPV